MRLAPSSKRHSMNNPISQWQHCNEQAKLQGLLFLADSKAWGYCSAYALRSYYIAGLIEPYQKLELITNAMERAEAFAVLQSIAAENDKTHWIEKELANGWPLLKQSGKCTKLMQQLIAMSAEHWNC